MNNSIHFLKIFMGFHETSALLIPNDIFMSCISWLQWDLKCNTDKMVQSAVALVRSIKIRIKSNAVLSLGNSTMYKNCRRRNKLLSRFNVDIEQLNWARSIQYNTISPLVLLIPKIAARVWIMSAKCTYLLNTLPNQHLQFEHLIEDELKRQTISRKYC